VKYVYAYWIQTVAPSIYNVKVRKGASNFTLECEWEGMGTVAFQIKTPEKTYLEDELEVSEKTIVSMDAVPRYRCVKRVSLKMKPLPREEGWTVQLNLFQVSRYRLTIEVS
jgi:hypothetical protein